MNTASFSKGSINAIVLMRIFIGWHFLYEGVLKLYNPGWTSKAYLMSAELIAPVFRWMASDSMIGIIDYFNIFCLLIVGFTLVLGYYEKLGAVFGVGLLLLYYLAHPAIPGASQIGTEGSYWIINKNLIEAAGLYIIYQIPTGVYFGLGIFKKSSSNVITQ
jgi:thiosulfate dehydrogenase [quinone] large subunit